MKLVVETLAFFVTALVCAALVALGEPALAEIAFTQASSTIVETGFEPPGAGRGGR